MVLLGEKERELEEKPRTKIWNDHGLGVIIEDAVLEDYSKRKCTFS